MTAEDMKNVEILHKVLDWEGISPPLPNLSENNWEIRQLNELRLLAIAIAQVIAPSDDFLLIFFLKKIVCCVKSNVRWRNAL